MRRLIFGCGYLGSRVAKSWLDAGDEVFAVTRNSDNLDRFKSQGISPIVGDVTEATSLAGKLPKCDTVLIAIGMDRTRYTSIKDVYVGGMKSVLENLNSETGHVIYISSTGVYGDFGGAWVDENSPTEPTRDGGKACLEAEQLLMTSEFSDRSNVLRLSGIYGPDRIPSLATVQAKAWDKLNPSGFLNLVHVDDIVSAVRETAKIQPFGEVLLVSDDRPVERKTYYEFLAEQLKVGEVVWPAAPPQDLATRRSGMSKRVSNEKMRQVLNFDLAYPNYRLGLRSLLKDLVDTD